MAEAKRDTDSSSDDGDNDGDDFDIISAFDSITFIEQEFINEGKQNGQKIVEQRSYNQGYEMGKKEGSKLGQELGFYHGFIAYLQFEDLKATKLSLKSHKAILKISKHLNKLSLSSKYLNENDTFIKESIQIIRSTFKSLLNSTGLLKKFQSLDDNDDSVPDTVKAMLKLPLNNHKQNNKQEPDYSF